MRLYKKFNSIILMQMIAAIIGVLPGLGARAAPVAPLFIMELEKPSTKFNTK